ncbi:phosphatidylinositol kinase-related protein kinase tor1 [Sarracenia purpurea var. burkii]
MSSQGPKSSRPSKSQNQPSVITPSRSSSSSSSSLSSHLAMVELKQRILTSLSKLSDRDTHQIAVEDLEKIIQNLTPDGVSMLLNCLYDATNDPKPAVKKESLRLLAVLCATHGDSAATHLTKIISHIVKRLKDSDSAVRDSCRDAIGALSSQYLKGEGDNVGLGSVVSLFVKPLFEAMSEQNKGVQAGSAMCMAKMVECASDPPATSFQKLCPRICKHLNNPNFLAKAALLPVISSLSQDLDHWVEKIKYTSVEYLVGAIAPQNLESLLQSIHECLGSTDWATRKAAADTLSALAIHSSNLIEDGTTSTVTVLEACRLDKTWTGSNFLYASTDSPCAS